MDELTRLALRARDGETGAVEALLRATYGDVRRLCALLVDQQSSADLAQDCCARVIRALRGFRAESSARTWILGITRRTCMDELRTRSRRRGADTRLAAATPRANAPSAEAESSAGVYQLVALLEPDRRAAFVLTQFFGLSYREAADACSCPPGTIRSRVARAREDLLALLDQGDHRAETQH
ncbi:MAG: sigma-70 family RNA polymerase sigma factor [Solirubrobacterales bacterium]|nr:sigma-70 family RNA polymerase sigma factor [Solirubrobacterales bacterium]